ncbi:MAG TPA: T9SS type A sorting domain-containing protein [Chitinophagaceae bacterium]|nr:T9SS type A sorting domain-containing protein [Chitinophagaceae bacterium]
MKRIKSYIALLLVLCTHYSYSQCLLNPDFGEECGTHTTGTCGTFQNDCIHNWKKSHGTPDLILASPSGPGNVMHMWGKTYSGEGVFALYNFVQGNTYTIYVRAARANNNINGELRIAATNDLVAQHQWNYTCDWGIPSPSSKQDITSTNLTTSYVTYGWDFTPNANYSQFWIYPYYFAGDQFDIYVDFVVICPNMCTGTVYYNTGTAQPGTSRGAYVKAGSSALSGGSGTVTITDGTTTRFAAINDVYLLPEFEASITSGEFIAEIVSCSTQIRTRPEPPLPEFGRPVQPPPLLSPESLQRVVEMDDRDGPWIYPNPARNVVSLQWPRNAPAEITAIQVLNEQGVVVKQVGKKSYTVINQRIEIFVADLPNGLYVVKVITDKETLSQKFQKIK